MNLRSTIRIASIAAAIAAIYGGWLAYLAWRNLVTLDVRNMEVREVVKKMERQTWETILVEKTVQGKVTLKVRRAPLQEVLRLVAGQTFARSSLIYPLYSGGPSLALLEQGLRGEIDASTRGWTNIRARGPTPMPGGPMFGPRGFAGPNAAPENERVSLNFTGQDIAFAAMAFNRFAQTRVVPEDGTSALITLSLKEATVPGAVAQLAKKAGRKWTTLYVLQGGLDGGPRGPGGPGGGPQFAMRGGNEMMRFGFGGPETTDAQRDEMRKQRETLEQELQQALPEDERQKLQAAQEERARQMQEFASMTDEQRRERMMQMGGGRNMSQMNRERLMNSTPEQRAEMSRRMGQRGPGGGPGESRGPGGPPR